MDRRRHTRNRFSQIIEITLQRIPGGGPMVGKTVLSKSSDLSVSGIRLTVDTYLPRNSSVVLKIYRKGSSQSFLRHGVVRWLESPETRKVYLVGIEFTDLAAHEKSGWAEFVEEVGGSPE